ncbi:MAG: hypothetical protein M3P39_04495, partial [Actinomycetota bacterium]|nr:hypothetical protein [Actinomycetota bacterium]
TAARPVLLAPFPVVRIAGVIRGSGATVRLLTVRAPRGAVVTVRCIGRRCPFRVVRKRIRASDRRLVRVRRLAGRRLPPATRLEVRVTAPARVGKFTSFTFRAKRAPRRSDRCLLPGRSAPVACPSA